MRKSLFLAICLLFLLAEDCSKKNGDVHLPVTQPAANITLISPTRGPAGTAVTIDGQGFIFQPGDSVSVLFNGVRGKVVSLSATQVVAYAPAGATSGAVTVITARGTLTGAVFNYGAPFRISGATPSFGPPGTTVRISGIGFGNNPSQLRVSIGVATALTVAGSVSDTALSVTVPDFAGTGNIRVIVNTDSVSGPLFNYTTITGLNPKSGLDGSVDTVFGTGFSSVLSQNKVTYKGIPATLIGGDTGKLIVKVPMGVSGNVMVAVTLNGGTTKPTNNDLQNNIDVFKDTSLLITYLGYTGNTSASIADSFKTNQGPVGSFVRIHGYGFGMLPSSNQVFFNGVPAQIISGGLDTILYAKVPPGAGSGPISITANGQTVTGPTFTITPTGATVFAGSMPHNVNYFPYSTPYTDGVFASLINPYSVAFDKQYNLYAIDDYTNIDGSTPILQFSPDGTTVTTFATNMSLPPAGWQGPPAFKNLVFDQAGNAYASTTNNIIKISSGTVSIFAGSPTYASGYADGQDSTALFDNIGALAVDPSGNLLAADINNHCIRKISPKGLVTTPYSAGFLQGTPPYACIATDKTGNIYYSSNNGDNAIAEITTSGVLRVLGWWNGSSLSNVGNPAGLIVDQNGKIYFTAGSSICQLVNGSPVKIPDPIDFSYGFGFENYLAMDAVGNMYVADGGNGVIRKVILH